MTKSLRLFIWIPLLLLTIMDSFVVALAESSESVAAACVWVLIRGLWNCLWIADQMLPSI